MSDAIVDDCEDIAFHLAKIAGLLEARSTALHLTAAVPDKRGFITVSLRNRETRQCADPHCQAIFIVPEGQPGRRARFCPSPDPKKESRCALRYRVRQWRQRKGVSV